MLMIPGMRRGQAKLLIMPEKNPMVMLKMAEQKLSTEETNTILMHRRKAELNNVKEAEGEMQMPGMQRG